MTRTSFLKINGKSSSSSPAKINSIWAVFKDTVIRCRNPFILYLVAMVIFGPIGFLMEYPNAVNRLMHAEQYSSSVSMPSLAAMGLLTTVGASIVIPMVIFSYLDNRRALDTFHALPVTRGKQFLGTISAGLFLLFVPFVVTIPPVMAVVDVMQACRETANRGDQLVWENITSAFTGEYLQVTLTVAVTALMFYMLMSFLMFCCSTILESAGYFAIVMLGYVALVSMGMNQIGNATFGFTRNGFWLTDVLLRFSPLYYFISSGRRLNVWPYALQIMLLAIVFGLLAWRRAVSRKSEQAGGYIWSPVYYIVAMGGSLAVGLALFRMLEGSGAVFALFTGSVLGILAYIILDTVRNRGFKNIVRSLVTGVAGVVGVGVFSVLVAVTGTFGYESWLPTEDDIASVSISDDNFLDGFPLSDAESIHQVVSFHQAVLSNQKTVEDGLNLPLVEYLPFEFDDNQAAYAYGETTVDIEYTMKNGRIITRQYNNVPLTLTRYLYQIAGSTAYSCAIADQLETFSEVLPIMACEYGTEGNWRYEFGISDQLGIHMSNSSTMPLTEQDARAFFAAMGEDFRRRSEGWKVNPSEQPIGQITFYVDNPAYTNDTTYRSYQLYIYKSDLNTVDLLEKFGYYNTNNPGKVNSTVSQNDIINYEVAVIVPEDYTKAAEVGDASAFHFSDERIGVVSRSYDDEDDVWDVKDELYAASGEANPHRTGEEQGMLVLNGGEKVPVCQRDFTVQEIEELLGEVMLIGYSDEPMPVLWLDGRTYLIPEENMETVRELIFG